MKLLEQLGLVLSRPSVIMERLRGMFSNADEVQGDSEPPESANSCSACINLLIHLRKLGIWGTPVTVHSNTTEALFSSPVCFFPLILIRCWLFVLFWGGGGVSCCSVFSLSFPLELSHLSFSPFFLSLLVIILFPYHLS